MGVCDWDLFEVLDEFGCHCWGVMVEEEGGDGKDMVGGLVGGWIIVE